MNYREEMLRTLSPKGDLYEHALYGLVTEAAEALDTLKKVKFYGQEFDKVHALEELGDIRWYVELAYVAFDLETKDWRVLDEHYSHYDYGASVRFIVYQSAHIMEECYEGNNALYALQSILDFLNNAAECLGYTMEDVESANIAKLKKRYPEKWTEDKAMNRDLEAERKELDENS